MQKEICIPEVMPATPSFSTHSQNMSDTYVSLHYHLVSSTKSREPVISAEWLPRLHEYLGGINDHVHLLVGLRPTHCLSDFMGELKKASSFWVHQEVGLSQFAWQEGYAAFSVSATSREAVKDYIAQQQEHHRVKTFRDELMQMLVKAGVTFKPEHLD